MEEIRNISRPRRPLYGRLALALLLGSFALAVPAQELPTGSSSHNLRHLANLPDPGAWKVETLRRGGKTYAVLGSQGFGLRIYDITDPAQPAALGAYRIPGREESRGYFSPGSENSLAVGENIAILTRDTHAQGAFVPEAGLPCSEPSCVVGLEIVDLTDLHAPKRLSFVETVLGPANVRIHGNRAYVAYAEGWALDIVDLSNPSQPRILARWANANRKVPYTPPQDVNPDDPRNPIHTPVCDLPKGSHGPERCFSTLNQPFSALFRPHNLSIREVGGRVRLYIASRNTSAQIVDATDPFALRQIAEIDDECGDGERYYIGACNGHSAEVSDDGRWLLITDQEALHQECPGTGAFIYDLANEEKPRKLGAYFANSRAIGAGIAPDNFCTATFASFLKARPVAAIGWQSAGAWLVKVNEQGSEEYKGVNSAVTTQGKTVAHAREQMAHANDVKLMWFKDQTAKDRVLVLVADHNRGLDIFEYVGDLEELRDR